jgi:hypothetical protein
VSDPGGFSPVCHRRTQHRPQPSKFFVTFEACWEKKGDG